PLLVTALASRLSEAGVPAGTPVVLAAAGSSEPRAGTEVAAQADLLAAELGVPVVAAFAAAGQPGVGGAGAGRGAGARGPGGGAAREDRRPGGRGDLPAGTWPVPRQAGRQRCRLGHGTAWRPPGRGGADHRQIPHAPCGRQGRLGHVAESGDNWCMATSGPEPDGGHEPDRSEARGRGGLITRHAGRVVLLDPDDRVLLMRYDDGLPNG